MVLETTQVQPTVISGCKMTGESCQTGCEQARIVYRHLCSHELPMVVVQQGPDAVQETNGIKHSLE